MAALSVLAGYLGSSGDASGVPLAFLSPTVNAAGAQPAYNLSEPVTVSWTTPYDLTTLYLLQGPDASGNFASDVVAANYSRDQTSFTWDAASLNGASLSSDFLFRLQKGDSPNTCDGCSTDSAVFSVKDASSNTAEASSSAASSAITTSTSSAVPSSTASVASSTSGSASDATTMVTTTSSHAATAAAAKTASGTSSAASATQTQFIPPPFKLSMGEAVGIGLGVGLGIIAAIAFYACVHLLLKRRRARKAAAGGAARGAAGEKAVRPESTDTFQSAVSSLNDHRFVFEQSDGTIKHGWETLFGGDRLMVGSDKGGASRQTSKRSRRSQNNFF